MPVLQMHIFVALKMFKTQSPVSAFANTTSNAAALFPLAPMPEALSSSSSTPLDVLTTCVFGALAFATSAVMIWQAHKDRQAERKCLVAVETGVLPLEAIGKPL